MSRRNKTDEMQPISYILNFVKDKEPQIKEKMTTIKEVNFSMLRPLSMHCESEDAVASTDTCRPIVKCQTVLHNNYVPLMLAAKQSKNFNIITLKLPDIY